MPEATIEEFDLDIQVQDIIPIESYWPPTTIGPCRTQDTTCAVTLCVA
jgi:hypothetical protein